MQTEKTQTKQANKTRKQPKPKANTKQTNNHKRQNKKGRVISWSVPQRR